MSKELIIHSAPKGVEVALLENGKLTELHQETNNKQFNVGDIYLAKIRKLVPSLNAAFINVGYKKDGFLHYSDLGPQVKTLHKFVTRGLDGNINTHLLGSFQKEPDTHKEGKIDKVFKKKDSILVQVVKEPISTKGPRLTSEIGMPGRTMVLTPFNDFVGVSKKIEDQDERKRLKRLISSIKPEGFGVIVRTNATGKGVAELHQELEQLLERWKNVTTQIKAGNKMPYKVHSEAGMTRAIVRDYVNESLDKIIVDDKEIFEGIKDYVQEIAPSKAGMVQFYKKGDKHIFSKFGVTKQVKSSFGKEVKMDSGAYLVIEHTEALHVIDVNSGNNVSNNTAQDEMALRVNLESADEVARQLRLRDIGGIIIVDFIDMKDPDARTQVYKRVKEAMAVDRAKHLVLPITRFGLMQITRQRTKPVMNIKTKEKCPTCDGTGNVASTLLIDEEIEEDIATISELGKHKSVCVEAHPVVAGFLKNGLPSLRMKWAWKHKLKLKVKVDENLPLTEYRFVDKEGEVIELT